MRTLAYLATAALLTVAYLLFYLRRDPQEKGSSPGRYRDWRDWYWERIIGCIGVVGLVLTVAVYG